MYLQTVSKFLDGLLSMEVFAIGHTDWVAVYQFLWSVQQAKALVLLLLCQSGLIVDIPHSSVTVKYNQHSQWIHTRSIKFPCTIAALTVYHPMLISSLRLRVEDVLLHMGKYVVGVGYSKRIHSVSSTAQGQSFFSILESIIGVYGLLLDLLLYIYYESTKSSV